MARTIAELADFLTEVLDVIWGLGEVPDPAPRVLIESAPYAA